MICRAMSTLFQYLVNVELQLMTWTLISIVLDHASGEAKFWSAKMADSFIGYMCMSYVHEYDACFRGIYVCLCI